MAARFKHEPCSDPVKFFEKMLSFFAHIGPFELWAAASNYSDWVSASMGINTKKGLFRHIKP
jgi:hypothetical protein